MSLQLRISVLFYKIINENGKTWKSVISNVGMCGCVCACVSANKKNKNSRAALVMEEA